MRQFGTTSTGFTTPDAVLVASGPCSQFCCAKLRAGQSLAHFSFGMACISHQSRWKCHAILGEFDIFVWFSSFALFSVGFESFLRSLERIAWSAQPVPKESKAV